MDSSINTFSNLTCRDLDTFRKAVIEYGADIRYRLDATSTLLCSMAAA